MTDYNLKYIETIYLKAEVLVYNKDQGKSYLEEVEIYA